MADLLSRDAIYMNRAIDENVNVVTGPDNPAPTLRRSARLAAKAAASTANTPISINVTPIVTTGRTQGETKRTRGRPKNSTNKSLGAEVTSHERYVSIPPPDAPSIRPHIPLVMPSPERIVPERLPKPDMSIPVDTMNNHRFDMQPETYFPATKQLFDNPDVSVNFSNKFHGTVPERTRDKVRELALKNYNIQITRGIAGCRLPRPWPFPLASRQWGVRCIAGE